MGERSRIKSIWGNSSYMEQYMKITEKQTYHSIINLPLLNHAATGSLLDLVWHFYGVVAAIISRLW